MERPESVKEAGGRSRDSRNIAPEFVDEISARGIVGMLSPRLSIGCSRPCKAEGEFEARSERIARSVRLVLAGSLLSGPIACGSGTLDAGRDNPADALPVGRDNPVIVTNDGAYDNWHGEYAVLLAHAGGPPLAGIVISAGGMWYDLEANFSGWQDFVTRARESGLADVPDPIQSAGPPLQRPENDDIDSTPANDSEGARFIVRVSSELGRPDRPLVVATGGRLTDIADAYLIDPTVTERVVVVSSLGTFSKEANVAIMGRPNGEMDPWADFIVIHRFRYVQVSAFYDQLSDLPEDRLTELPDNPLGAWMSAKRSQLLGTPLASDQVSVIALGVPRYTSGFSRVSPSDWQDGYPTLVPDENGDDWLVTASDGEAARERLWDILRDPATFEP